MVAPLNWGTGHATRCIPLINCLLENGFEVVLGSDGAALKILRDLYPKLPHFEFPEMKVTYSKGNSQAWKLLVQLPGMINYWNSEKKHLDSLLSKNAVDLIISDNRYGIYHKSIPSVLITHQLNPQLPTPFKRSSALLHKKISQYISRYNRIWIPDIMDKQLRLTGKLSQYPSNSQNIRSIGLLSRFSSDPSPSDYQYDYLALISGPEPQRAILEEKLIHHFQHLNGRKLVIAGNPKGPKRDMNGFSGIDYIPFVDPMELGNYLHLSKNIVCRAGYSTIMDLITIRRKAVLIPTPGQTEQEYLAKHLADLKLFVTQSQGNINIDKAIRELENLTLDNSGYHGLNIPLILSEIDQLTINPR